MPTAPNNAVFKAMVLGYHRYEVADPVVSSEAGEQGDADVHHALGFRDHDRAPPEPRQPMPLPVAVPLVAIWLIPAPVGLPARQVRALKRAVFPAELAARGTSLRV